MQGMVNCFRVCREDFENTVRMVASRRGLEPEEVKEILFKMKEKYGDSEEYMTLRKNLPHDFPI